MNMNEEFEKFYAKVFVDPTGNFVITPEQIKARRGPENNYSSSMYMNHYWNIFCDVINSDLVKGLIDDAEKYRTSLKK